MRIVHVVRQFLPNHGGLEEFVKNLVIEQQALGHSVDVYTTNSNFQSGRVLPRCSIENGINVERFSWFGSKRYPICLISIKRLNQYDIVHVHAIDFFVDYLSFVKRLGLLNVKLVLTTHGGFFHTPKFSWVKNIFWRMITPFSLTRFDDVVCCSNNDFDLFVKLKSDVKLIENGVQLQKFGKLVDNVHNGQDLLCFGRFGSNKRVDQLVEWFGHSDYVSGRLKIIGRSESGDVGCIREAIATHGNNRVDLLLDVGDDEIVENISSCRYVVSASEYEGFGLGVVELMSYGLIPVLSDRPKSFVKFIDDSGVGTVFGDGAKNFNEGLMALDQHFSDKDKGAAMRYADNFSWKQVSLQYMSVLSDK